MRNIPALTIPDDNLGSIRDILFIPVDSVTSIKAPVSGELEFDCLQSGASPVTLFKLEFTDDTCELRYEEKKSANGPYFPTRISGLIPKDYAFRNPDFTEMQNHKFFVITRDNNGKSRLHGYIELDGSKQGMEFSADFSTKANRAGYNGFPFEFKMDSLIRPQVMEDITSTPVNPGFPYDPGGVDIGDIDPGPGSGT
jgi:hypothetical protein